MVLKCCSIIFQRECRDVALCPTPFILFILIVFSYYEYRLLFLSCNPFCNPFSLDFFRSLEKKTILLWIPSSRDWKEWCIMVSITGNPHYRLCFIRSEPALHMRLKESIFCKQNSRGITIEQLSSTNPSGMAVFHVLVDPRGKKNLLTEQTLCSAQPL